MTLPQTALLGLRLREEGLPLERIPITIDQAAVSIGALRKEGGWFDCRSDRPDSEIHSPHAGRWRPRSYEPTAGQDLACMRRLENILDHLQKKGTAVLTITHDME